QRLLHPTRRARLRLRDDLRRLRLLQHHRRVPAHPQTPSRARHQPRPTGTGRALQPPHRRHRQPTGGVMNTDPRRKFPDHPTLDDESDQVLTTAVDTMIVLRSPMWHGDSGAVLHALATLTATIE